MIDLGRVRQETRGCKEFTHFGNAGASPMPEPVYASVIAHLESEQAVGGYEAERRAKSELGSFYIGIDPEMLRNELFRRSISTSVSTVEHALLDLGKRGTGPIKRVSVHYFNTEAEIDRFISVIAEFQKKH